MRACCAQARAPARNVASATASSAVTQAIQRHAGADRACPSTGPQDFAPAAVWPSSCRDYLRAPAGHPCAGARTTLTRRHPLTPGKLTTVCGRLCGDRLQRCNILGLIAQHSHSWRTGSPRRSHARCDPAPPRSGRSGASDVRLATSDGQAVSLIHVRLSGSITVYYRALGWVYRQSWSVLDGRP